MLKPTFQKLVAAGIPNNPPRWPEATAIVKRILKVYMIIQSARSMQFE